MAWPQASNRPGLPGPSRPGGGDCNTVFIVRSAVDACSHGGMVAIRADRSKTFGNVSRNGRKIALSPSCQPVLPLRTAVLQRLAPIDPFVGVPPKGIPMPGDPVLNCSGRTPREHCGVDLRVPSSTRRRVIII